MHHKLIRLKWKISATINILIEANENEGFKRIVDEKFHTWGCVFHIHFNELNRSVAFVFFFMNVTRCVSGFLVIL